MQSIRKLEEVDFSAMIKLKIDCWSEELAGRAENTLNHDEELSWWTTWFAEAQKNQDTRFSLGCFENEKLIGVVITSFVSDWNEPESGIEVNGLWVNKNYRRMGIARKLLLETLQFFHSYSVQDVYLYNHHYAPSNAFYKYLGGDVIKQEMQIQDQLCVDIFKFNLKELQKRLMNK